MSQNQRNTTAATGDAKTNHWCFEFVKQIFQIFRSNLMSFLIFGTAIVGLMYTYQDHLLYIPS